VGTATRGPPTLSRRAAPAGKQASRAGYRQQAPRPLSRVASLPWSCTPVKRSWQVSAGVTDVTERPLPRLPTIEMQKFETPAFEKPGRMPHVGNPRRQIFAIRLDEMQISAIYQMSAVSGIACAHDLNL
jgi:hypothetical protein